MRFKFELVFYAVHHISHYTLRIHPEKWADEVPYVFVEEKFLFLLFKWLDR